MGRPRKYQTDAECIEARKKADRERVKRFRDAKRTEREAHRKLALEADESDANIPPFDPSTALPINEEVLKRMKEPSWRD